MPPITGPYSYTDFITARGYLALRLGDTAKVFWTDAEMGLYIQEAMRVWNALTATWCTDFTFTATPADPSHWYQLNNLANSPRPYTQTDFNLYAYCLYHVMEPQLSAGAYTGSSQFTLADFTQSFERRQNEVLQLTATNSQLLPQFALTPNSRVVNLPTDSILDVRRVRWVPTLVTNPVTLPQVLWREDPKTFSAYTPKSRQQSGTPRTYSLTFQPVLTVETNPAPNIPSNLDLLTIMSGTSPAPPASVPVFLPDDWNWVLKYGILMDLYTKDSESKDIPRAAYCKQRYEEGISLMQSLPWVLAAYLDNVPTGIVSVMEKDKFSPRWESNTAARQSIVVGGTDLFAPSPVPTGLLNVGVTLRVVSNAPVPVADSDKLEVSHDTLQAILDYAMHIASLKMGGEDFSETMIQLDNFHASAMAANNRIKHLSIYSKAMRERGRLEEVSDPRFTGATVSTDSPNPLLPGGGSNAG